MGNETLVGATDVGRDVDSLAGDAEHELADGRIEEIDALIQSLREQGYSPQQIRRMAELIRERDGLIRRLFELGPPIA